MCKVPTGSVVLAAMLATVAAANQYNTVPYGAKQTYQQAPAAYGNSHNSAAYQPQQQQGGYGKGYGYEEKHQEHPAKYQFHWNVKDDQSYNNYYHNEARDGDNTYGEYGVLLPDGRYQTVKYTVDKWGYKADVQYQGEAKYDPPAPAKQYGGGGGGYGHEQPQQASYHQPQQAYGQQQQQRY